MRLSNEQWKAIFRNIEEDIKEHGLNAYQDEGVQVFYLDPMTEDCTKWGLGYGEELFEDYFQTESEAMRRLEDMEKMYLNTKF